MQHTLVAVFDNNADAQSAMDELLASGFSRQEVRMSSGGSTGSTGSTASTHAHDSDTGIGSSIKHFFSDLFGSDDHDRSHVNRYEGAVSSGKCVVTLSADSLPEVERAADIVERFGPIDIDEHSDGGAMSAGAMGMDSGRQQSAPMSAQSANLQGSTARTDSLQRDTSTQSGATQSIPVVEEELKVGKREVQRGGVRIFSHVVETPVNESVNLREEHVDVQRRTVDQPISPTDATAFKEQTIEMRETSEEAVVQKSARVVEEVTVGKQVNQRQEQIKDTVRHTEVEVERLAGADDDSEYRSHYQANYAATGGSYDDYAPAYTYGSQMRSQYKGRQWDDVEGDLRSDWDARHTGGPSTWEKMKAAVRHGWDRMTD
ncbi:YsnF/AvaK domain-containing protein [Massilia sp. UMI-21]|nr:YsnF/AvaK domain-containing protein [Massilia sp. UMI-21]